MKSVTTIQIRNEGMSKLRRPQLKLSKSPKREELVKLIVKIYCFFEYCNPEGLTKQDAYRKADAFVSEKTKEFRNWQPALKYFRTEWIPKQKAVIDNLMPASNAGGVRKGAGRKIGITTTVMRIPEHIKPLVHLLIQEYKTNPNSYSILSRCITDKVKFRR